MNLTDNYASLAISLSGKALASMCERLQGFQPPKPLPAGLGIQEAGVTGVGQKQAFSSAMRLCHHLQHVTLKLRD